MDKKRADFERKCVVALLKRLRRTHDPKNIRNLKSALKSKSYKTECITIPKSLDGRIQVSIRASMVRLNSEFFTIFELKSELNLNLKTSDCRAFKPCVGVRVGGFGITNLSHKNTAIPNPGIQPKYSEMGSDGVEFCHYDFNSGGQ